MENERMLVDIKTSRLNHELSATRLQYQETLLLRITEG